MKNKNYTVNIDRQGDVVNTECKPITEFITMCIVCGNEVVIGVWDTAPKVCEDCKKAVAYAKKLMEKENER